MRRLRGFEPSVLSPPLDEDRLAREYEVVRARTLRGARAPARWALSHSHWAGAGVAAATAAALCAWLVLVRPLRPFPFRSPKLADNAVLVGGGSEQPVRVALPEGSRVELASNTRAKLTSAQPKAVRIDVETGSIDIEASHVEGRTFVVGAGAYEVRVTGTHFRVDRVPGERVSVHVDEGVVEVSSPGGTARRLGAGEEWSAPDSPAPASLASEGVPSEGRSSEPVGPPPSVPHASAPPPAAPVALPAVAPPPPAPPKDVRRETASELFDQAQRARTEGRAVDAADAFDRVRRTYRKDAHAPLAAFELGRLRLDALEDPAGAAEALNDAIVLGPSSPLREDAEARRVEALSRAGDRAGCTAARDAYLARWPSGTYRRAVELYCSK
jgi:transmembrane sensor